MDADGDRQRRRIAYWGDSYIRSTRKSHLRAQRFAQKDDYFTAYMYLFAAFNNLYSLLAGFNSRGEAEKIKVAIGKFQSEHIDSIYTADYIQNLNNLNRRTPEQFKDGPDECSAQRGVVNMQKYFLGNDPSACAVSINEIEIAALDDTARQKLITVQQLASTVLYTIRNNHFHAVKGANNLLDKNVLKLAYKLLNPIVQALLPLGQQEITDACQQVGACNEGGQI